MISVWARSSSSFSAVADLVLEQLLGPLQLALRQGQLGLASLDLRRADGAQPVECHLRCLDIRDQAGDDLAGMDPVAALDQHGIQQAGNGAADIHPQRRIHHAVEFLLVREGRLHQDDGAHDHAPDDDANQTMFHAKQWRD